MAEDSYDVYAYEERYRKVYEAGAESWEEPIPTEALVKFVSHLRTSSKFRVIDTGCGEGRDSIFLAKTGFEVTGIDASWSAIERAKMRARKEVVGLDFVVADIANLPIKDEVYDLAVNIACLHMVTDQRVRDRYLREVHRVLKPGAKHFSCNLGVDKSTSVAEYYARLENRPGDVVARKIKVRGKERLVNLRIIAAWPRSKKQYVKEFEKVGFEIINGEKMNTLFLSGFSEAWLLRSS